MRACPAPLPYALREDLVSEAAAAIAEARRQRWLQGNDSTLREEHRKLPSCYYTAPLGGGGRA
eukprot:5494923-Alexandrium_andersonii.AAC.1